MSELCRGRNANLIYVDVIQSIKLCCSKKHSVLQQKLRHPDLIFCASITAKFTLNSRFSPSLEKASRLGKNSPNRVSYLAVMYQSIPSLTIPPGNFFDGRIPHPSGKREFKTPTPGPIKRAKTPPRRIFLNYSL